VSQELPRIADDQVTANSDPNWAGRILKTAAWGGANYKRTARGTHDEPTPGAEDVTL
jgi:hypothetical protein